MKQIWWVSNYKMTFEVVVENGIIVDPAPIGRKFIKQPFVNLCGWMGRQGGFIKHLQSEEKV